MSNPVSGGGPNIPNPSRYDTRSARRTAASHQSDIANQLDPRADSYLDNRAQYPPGTTTQGNVQAGATTLAANPQANNLGPYESDLKSTLDPRVNRKTGEMGTRSQGLGASQEPVLGRSNAERGAIGGGPVGGASTGSPAAPTAAASSDYPHERSMYNPASGSGFTPEREKRDAGTNPNYQAPTTTAGTAPNHVRTDTSGTLPGPTSEKDAKKGQSDKGIKGAIAGIHGAGESIRGTVGAAIDRAFNDQEGVAKNQAIAREGEWEVKAGRFANSTKQREGFKSDRQ
ncbi:hypothetical protein BGW36DRAFT_87344 [Talaromyces proteolyticus]|uniref:Uncharacterized protein n=1 Tax=Talaromyces proteolyticus TaxID=1131652 RepID=A0AAD4L4M1_9EURO|nr:uncharacterized protein BGW36DRAFT_87344 [Talaromyces proteolyticus]KAH8703482.1 hypothetical protein BGW36DRAFT_87344 [Talaromyces proteolyticus]